MILFLTIQYRLGRIDETYLDALIANGTITQDDFDSIRKTLDPPDEPTDTEESEDS